ncbi:FxsB family cyclophane-forming radical SAM/SPASM peptide maturase [Dactylosporangium sp. NPDC005572]|uniref:FxsB family cyclophane-forming radical SAM/SPASM peptide maturase n=1 Tax=Dactylosporangium sp. NPDC005572 TaxID=3156889 RepID=UPI0033A5244E
MVKIHGRCDLACDYCYMYEHADQSWKRRPPAMTADVGRRLSDRIAEHVRHHRLTEIRVILHGGEPLLAGVDGITRLVDGIRAAVNGAAAVRFAIQTNGVRLDRAFLECLRALGVSVGVSLDGGVAEHNGHRRFAHGGASFPRVAAALELLRSPPYREIYGGILCTVDLRNDPLEVYHGLLAFDPPLIDLRPPHGNWAFPPPGRVPGDPATPYADWLMAVFEEWYGAPTRSTGIRLFDSIIQMLLGGPSDTEDIGLTRTGAVVIDTDGSIQASDVLKTTRPGGPETGLSVLTHTFDDALAAPAIRAEQRSPATVPGPCRGCEVVAVCGGGLHAHRFHPTAGFDRPSVYCPDLLRLISHVRDRVRADLARLPAAT